MSADLHLPHQLTGANKTLTAQCHCKSVHFIITVPTSALPLPVHLCHCRTCRYIHGTLCCFHAPLPKGVEPQFIAPSSLASSLTGYIHARAASERFFCSTCGCHIGDRDLRPDPETGEREWRVATSIFSSHGEDTFQIRTHTFTDSAGPPPNLATWLPRINNRAIHVWNPPAPNDPNHPPSPPPPAEQQQQHTHGPKDEEKGERSARLRAQCHCGGISFTLPRPSPTPPSPSPSPPPNRVLARYLAANPLKPSSPVPNRVATLCLCADCRLVSGAHAVPWTFLPLSAVRPRLSPRLEPLLDLDQDDEDEESGRVDGGPGGYATLRTYRSSEHVTRGFCGVCGATAFYLADVPRRVVVEGGDGDNTRDLIVDVAVGLLHADDGPAALDWLTWRTGRLAGWETGTEFDEGFAEGLREGLAKWGMERYGGDWEMTREL